MTAEKCPVLECRGLCKSYKNGFPVLEDLNITLAPGRIVGLMGPNGCGKSTLIKLITGLLTPDSGTIGICGVPRSEESCALVSYLPERTYFNSWMKVSEIVKFFEEFFPDFDSAKAVGMLSDLGIDESARLKSLSKGAKEKVQLILVMSRRARLYLLDEPIAGVDPAARDYIMQTIISNFDPNAALLITTHLISDIEPLLDDFIFMDSHGKIIMSGVADDVRALRGMSLDEIFREVFKCIGNY